MKEKKDFRLNIKKEYCVILINADFLLYDSIIIEVKSVAAIIDNHVYQALSYLSVSQQKLGMVINFGEKSLTWKRIVF